MKRDPQLDFEVVVAGKKHPIRFSDFACFELEGLLGGTINDLNKRIATGSIGIRDLLGLLTAGLEGGRDRELRAGRRPVRRVPWTTSAASELVEPAGGVVNFSGVLCDAYIAHVIRPVAEAVERTEEEPAPEADSGKDGTSGSDE